MPGVTVNGGRMHARIRSIAQFDLVGGSTPAHR
jgi:hypothetical protein